MSNFQKDCEFHSRKLHIAIHSIFTTFRDLDRSQDVLLTHGDSIDQICDNFRICATSSSNIISGIYNEQARIYGVQFHPEVDLTVNGSKMLSNFLLEIARITPSYTLTNRKEECIRYIRETVGNSKVLVSLTIDIKCRVKRKTNKKMCQLCCSFWPAAALTRPSVQPSWDTLCRLAKS